MTPNEIFNLLGGPVVLLKVPPGQKRPILKQWQKVTLKEMTPGYLAGLNGCNVGVALGAASGGLISIDFDSNDSLKEMLALNPWMNNTLMSRGVRGANIWLAIDGSFPASCDIFNAGPKAKICELRATGRQTIISGRHQSGRDYKNNAKSALRVSFTKIRWSAEAVLPWLEPPPAEDLHAKLVDKCGPPVIRGARGSIKINQSYFVQRFCMEHLVLFEQTEQKFYLYEETTGSWRPGAGDIIKEMLRSDWERVAPAMGGRALLIKGDEALLNALTSGVRSFSGRKDVFKRLPRGVLHIANGMLTISVDGSCELSGFDPQFYSRNPIPVSFNPDADCPQFKDMLAHSMSKEDAALFMRWFGGCLVEGNHAQRLLLMVGVAQSSKSTLVNVVRAIVGPENCAELRTQFLRERFEICRLVGKTLLTACDVPGGFLQHEGAQALKKLTGHDPLTGEMKGSMDSRNIPGDFGAVITCNETLLVRLRGENDVGAWRRRLLLIPFENAIAAESRVENYAAKLIKEEAEGILAFVVQGAIAHLKELQDGSDFKRTAEQQARVEKLLNESESLRLFVLKRIRTEDGKDISTDELVRAYVAYCREKAWRALAVKTVEKELVDLMMEIHNSRVGTHVIREEKRVRGYPNVALVEPEDNQSRDQG